jgi:hypothetical protein
MRKYLANPFLIGAFGTLALLGCTTGESLSSANTESTPVEKSKSNLAARVTGATTYFSGYTEIQTDGHPGTEKFADCGTDQVMTGWGGWTSGGDFTGVTAYCRSIGADGTLGSETSVSNGGSGVQVAVRAQAGWVVAGAGGWVNSSLRRATIFQCQWIPATKSIDANTCAWFGSDNNSSSEMQYDVRANLPNSSYWNKSIATGVGLTDQYDNVAEIRLTVGTLK